MHLLRTISRQNEDGTEVRYVQLAHNERHPRSGNAVAKVVHSFGRKDQLDAAPLSRLVDSISRQRTDLTSAQCDIPAKLGLAEPLQFLQLDSTTG